VRSRGDRRVAPFGLSLSKACFASDDQFDEGQGFDKLSPNGVAGIGASARPPALHAGPPYHM
jgi:hypothetical protein